MVAIASALGRWQGDRGFPDCPFCDEGMIGEEKCPTCDRDGIVDCQARDPARLIEGDSPGNVYDLVRAIIYARERKWSPTELGREPAFFVQAFEAFLPTVAKYIEEDREREKKKRG